MKIYVGDFVTCPRAGPGNFKVIDEDRMQFVLQAPNGERTEIFKVHCSPIMSAKERIKLRDEEKMARAEAASKIGRKKN